VVVVDRPHPARLVQRARTPRGGVRVSRWAGAGTRGTVIAGGPLSVGTGKSPIEITIIRARPRSGASSRPAGRMPGFGIVVAGGSRPGPGVDRRRRGAVRHAVDAEDVPGDPGRVTSWTVCVADQARRARAGRSLAVEDGPGSRRMVRPPAAGGDLGEAPRGGAAHRRDQRSNPRRDRARRSRRRPGSLSPQVHEPRGWCRFARQESLARLRRYGQRGEGSAGATARGDRACTAGLHGRVCHGRVCRDGWRAHPGMRGYGALTPTRLETRQG